MDDVLINGEIKKYSYFFFHESFLVIRKEILYTCCIHSNPLNFVIMYNVCCMSNENHKKISFNQK